MKRSLSSACFNWSKYGNFVTKTFFVWQYRIKIWPTIFIWQVNFIFQIGWVQVTLQRIILLLRSHNFILTLIWAKFIVVANRRYRVTISFHLYLWTLVFKQEILQILLFAFLFLAIYIVLKLMRWVFERRIVLLSLLIWVRVLRLYKRKQLVFLSLIFWICLPLLLSFILEFVYAYLK